MRSRSILAGLAAMFLALTLFGSVADARPTKRGVSKQRVGILARLIELERRKNAWLRKTFLE